MMDPQQRISFAVGATQALLDREEELIAGYPEVAYCGLITASATSLERLDEQGEFVVR